MFRVIRRFKKVVFLKARPKEADSKKIKSAVGKIYIVRDS